MLKPRLIARLDIKGEYLIKGIRLEGLRKIGNPNMYALNYYKSGVDELLLMDNVASLYGRNNLIDVIRKAAKNVFIPIAVGGGVRSEKDAENLLQNGADKVCINTAAVKHPRIITNLAKRFGSQCIVLSVEAKRDNDSKKWEVFTHNGREKTGLEVIDWIKKGINLGAGEILLTSVDFDGTGEGFDYDLITEASPVCTVPLIISGGLGKIEHIKKLKKITHVDAIASGNALHYKELSPSLIKKFLIKK